jgi:hypothetical protein
VTRYRAYGAVVVVGTVGQRVGRTRTFTPGYRTDVHALDVERVVAIVPGPDSGDAPVTASDVDAISRVGNVHYPDQPPSCGGKAENASFHEGDRVVLILGPPQPTADLWTVGPAVAVLDVAGERGSETATWRHRTSVGEGGCDGHLTYDLDRQPPPAHGRRPRPHLHPRLTVRITGAAW